MLGTSVQAGMNVCGSFITLSVERDFGGSTAPMRMLIKVFLLREFIENLLKLQNIQSYLNPFCSPSVAREFQGVLNM